jgi:hypothetical protein
MREICQDHLPEPPWMAANTRKLPGIAPIDLCNWIQIDEAYSAQMQRRKELISECLPQVFQLMPHALPMAQEVLEQVLKHTPQIRVEDGIAVRPDGVRINLDFDQPLQTLGHLVQEDFLIHEQQGSDHVLVGAILCFPASWTLAQKFGKSTIDIHAPVDEYDDLMASKVERLFSAIRHEQPLMRRNALRYADPELFQPNRDGDLGRVGNQGTYIRSERQTLVRLPRTRAVVFSVHTYQVKEENLTPAQAAGLKKHPIIFVGGEQQ